jgi:hypothetical protein
MGRTTEHVLVGRDVSTSKERAGPAKGNSGSSRSAIFHCFVTPSDTEVGGDI